MKLPSLALLALAAAVPLRAQSLFIVVENNVRYPVKSVEHQRPIIVVNGVRRPSQSQTFSLARAPIYGLGTVDISDFKVEITSAYTRSGQPQLHVYGRLKSNLALTHCFFVLPVTADAGKSVICDALPDLAANQDAVYDTLIDLPIHSLPGDGHFKVLIFSNGLQLTTSLNSPQFVAAQKQKTEAYLQAHAAH